MMNQRGGARQTFDQINRDYLAHLQAEIRRNSDLRPRLQIRATFALDIAATTQNPTFFKEVFTGYYVEDATDSNTYARISFTSAEAPNILNYTTLHRNDSADCGQEIKGAILTWPAQPGKTITIVFYLGVNFRPGSMNQILQGGVSVETGTGMTPVAAVSVTNAATLILAADSTRKKTTITNLLGSTLYVSGTNAVVGASGAVAGSLVGIPIPVGGSFEVTHSGNLYGITDSGSALVAINTES